MIAAAPAAPMQFALFDWLDETGRDQGKSYAERLRLLEVADELGFAGYHLAEHHATELSTVPSPNVFLAAAATRTRRLRLGALSYVLPLYDPLRLLEELCMLDQLSGGRLELGLSRGSTGEHVAGDQGRARAMFQEALTVLLQGLATGTVDHHGQFFVYDHAFTRLRPVQHPYPPLWYPTSSRESLDWVAANGLNTAFSVHLAPNFEHVVQMIARYQTVYVARQSDADRLNAHVAHPHVGFSMHVHVADTDRQAQEQAKPAYERFAHNFTFRYVRRGHPQRYAERSTFEDQLAHGRLLIGSPETVRAQLSSYLARAQANYFLGTFAFGSLTEGQMRRSLELFAREVRPGLP